MIGQPHSLRKSMTILAILACVAYVVTLTVNREADATQQTTPGISLVNTFNYSTAAGGIAVPAGTTPIVTALSGGAPFAQTNDLFGGFGDDDYIVTDILANVRTNTLCAGEVITVQFQAGGVAFAELSITPEQMDVRCSSTTGWARENPMAAADLTLVITPNTVSAHTINVGLNGFEL